MAISQKIHARLAQLKITLSVMLEHISKAVNPVSELDDWKISKQSAVHFSAVLIPIVTRYKNHSIILTKRSQHLNHHAGQISFPGGRVETSDKNAVDTALRETQEEIGIPQEQIDVAGFLKQHTTVSNFVITPIVGFVDPDYRAEIDKFEVEYSFEVPCEILLNANNYQHNKIFWQGEMRLFWELDYEQHNIWGATATILRNLAMRLADAEN